MLRNEIKCLLAKENITMTEIVKKLNEKNNTSLTIQNFSIKLGNSTLKYVEVEEILELLNYEIKWVKKGK